MLPGCMHILKSRLPQLRTTKRTPSVNQDRNLNLFAHTSQIHVPEFMPVCDQREGLQGPGDFLVTVVKRQASRRLWR
jgi:hypothetical protein